MKRFFISLITILAFPLFLFAQKERKEVNEGNDLYKSGNYAAAAKQYKKGTEKNNTSFEATFNLGNAYYKQGKYDDALAQYQQARALTQDSLRQAKTYHNAGNAHYQAKEYDKSVDAYKSSLRLNPKDDQTRYNLALAQQKLKQQQQQDKNQQEKQEMSDQTAKQMLDNFDQQQQELQQKMQQAKPQTRQVEKDW